MNSGREHAKELERHQKNDKLKNHFVFRKIVEINLGQLTFGMLGKSFVIIVKREIKSNRFEIEV